MIYHAHPSVPHTGVKSQGSAGLTNTSPWIKQSIPKSQQSLAHTHYINKLLANGSGDKWDVHLVALVAARSWCLNARCSLGYVLKSSKCTKKICSVLWNKSKSVCWKFLKRFCPNLLDQRVGLQNAKLAFQRRSKQRQQQLKTGVQVRACAGAPQRHQEPLFSHPWMLTLTYLIIPRVLWKDRRCVCERHKNCPPSCRKCNILPDTLFPLVLKSPSATV